MMKSNVMELIDVSDADLVAQSLSGSREAFGRIVARYQSLICALNYSATGDLDQSEDLAQETFLTAWKDLGKLREPAKLRSWLCRIARNQAYDSLRAEGREPSHDGEMLDSVHESPAPGPQPHEFAISREEAGILWKSIAQIPEVYREPLILYYREQQSIETVAHNLDLTEDAVKQRLSRGRKLLQDQVAAFVEGALKRTSPGKAFTVAVLAALPAMTISAKAATVGAAAAKGSATAKAATAAGILGALLSPVLGVLALWSGFSTSMETAKSDQERELNKAFYRRLGGCIAGFFVLFFCVMFWGGSLVKSHTTWFVGLVAGIALAYILGLAAFSLWCYRRRKNLIGELRGAGLMGDTLKPVWEYRSRAAFLGLPLLHARIGERLGEPIRAWIAIGDCAIGGLFAFGGLAIAPICMGGCAIGFLSFGGFAFGVLAIGGFGLGAWAYGGLAIGLEAFGGCAIAWSSAWGGYAIAKGYAIGGLTHAALANNQSASEAIKSDPFFKACAAVFAYQNWLNVLWVAPLIVQRLVIKRLGRRNSAKS
jgi:RNA polymerase sigma factor (sigma-70 family)